MADVLNLETESTPLNTELETPELESVTDQSELSLESTSNPVAEVAEIEEAPEAVAAAEPSTEVEVEAVGVEGVLVFAGERFDGEVYLLLV